MRLRAGEAGNAQILQFRAELCALNEAAVGMAGTQGAAVDDWNRRLGDLVERVHAAGWSLDTIRESG